MPKAMSNTDKAGGGKIPERMGAFERIGVPADVDESRSAAVCRRDDGAERIVIAARGYVLIVDPETGSCSQLYFPGARASIRSRRPVIPGGGSIREQAAIFIL
ncbi:hypothetical protein [Paenibacillus sp. JZ16]|uniref:hypothetical protein n=1 Tax=Paenibacillus sp. JZ16 TaxID=1906272 RepID=UPI001F42F3CD|nr:hypothetical protein [Paenibacillus sp. JZ16]